MARLLDERGYDAVTLAEIAAAAGLARTAMYNYYPDKETLLIAYTAHETALYLDKLRAALETVSTPVDQLRVYVRMQLEHLATGHIAAASVAGVLTDEGHKKMAEHVAPLWGTLRQIIADAVAERYLPDEDVELLLPLVTATIAGRSTADLSADRLEHAIDATVTYVLRGLGARLTADGRPRRFPAAR
ncbi:TetR/AcrR family transcriptional regulator [Yinghuangia seranimata]|uniref:TetR/AcrR family transcriptional regulator n=1 Tax=Yinghuangia seranimata TaxID=408067 RepID=UPI00248B3EBD|nr:TetR/AcrR family transcriptional regulator [Yinghuangia seranimata]MDI2132440.1 TetR/AcrR family transcriptional regulator [Yinghuangia seranimata]